MSDYKPTIGDVWPNEESMPAEVKKIMEEMDELNQQQLARIDANPKRASKAWWQVDTTGHGQVMRVWVNKPSGAAAGLWTFERTIAEDGRSIFKIVRSRHLDEMCAMPVGTWHVPAALEYSDWVYTVADLVGLRTAKSAAKRLGLAS